MINANRPKTRPELTGLSRPFEEHGPGLPLSLEWISEELIQETQAVWSKAYGRVISRDEAIEMLVNVKHVALVFMTSEGASG